MATTGEVLATIGAARAAQATGLAQQSVLNLAALRAVNDAPMPEGLEIFVVSTQCAYSLSRVAVGSLPADASDIKYQPTHSGVGTWIQSDLGHAAWRVAKTWSVIPATGTDENDGSPGHPMRSITGVIRKLGTRAQIAAQVTIQYTGATCTENVTIDADLASVGGILLQFMPTVVASGTLTASHLPNAPPTPGEDITITDASRNWTPYLASGGYRVDITSGAAAGCSFFVLKDKGAGVARCSYPANWDGGIFSTFIQPTFPCTYNVVQLTAVTGAIVDACSNEPLYSQTARFAISGANLTAWEPESSTSTVALSFVNVADPVGGGIYYIANCCIGADFIVLPGIEIDAIMISFLNTYIICEGKVFLDEGPIFQAVSFNGDDTNSNGGLFDIHEWAGIFDLSLPFRIQGCEVRIGNRGLFGNGNTCAIFQINPGAILGLTTGCALNATTTAPVEVVWGTGNNTTVTKARPYVAATDTLGALADTTFAALTGGTFNYDARRNNGSAVVQLQGNFGV